MIRPRIQFDAFRSKIAPGKTCGDASQVIDKYAGSVPIELVRLWKQDGLRSFGDSLLTFVNPDEYAEVFAQLFPDAGEQIVFARTAFGDLYVVHDDTVTAALVHYQELQIAGDEFDLFGYVVLNDDWYLDNILNRPLLSELAAKHGPLQPNECFGYSPAPVLGGPGTGDTLKRVDALIYLDILGQATAV